MMHKLKSESSGVAELLTVWLSSAAMLCISASSVCLSRKTTPAVMHKHYGSACSARESHIFRRKLPCLGFL